jgi:hypothetical protein
MKHTETYGSSMDYKVAPAVISWVINSMKTIAISSVNPTVNQVMFTNIANTYNLY